MQVILFAVICFLAIYGMYEIMYKLILYFTKNELKNAIFSHRIVALDDNVVNIEEFVRDIAMKKEEDLIIIDKTKCSETKKTLDIIKSDFSFVTVMSAEEYINYVNSMC